MAKKPIKINRERGKRLEIMIKRLGMTQTAFAASINYSGELISQIINGHKNLTESAIDIIVEKYPDYLREWLMGYGDIECATQEDKDKHEVYSYVQNSLARETWFKDSANLAGYSFKVSVNNENSFCPDFEYTLKKDGSSLVITKDNLIALEDEIIRFVGFRLGELFRKEGN